MENKKKWIASTHWGTIYQEKVWSNDWVEMKYTMDKMPFYFHTNNFKYVGTGYVKVYVVFEKGYLETKNEDDILIQKYKYKFHKTIHETYIRNFIINLFKIYHKWKIIHYNNGFKIYDKKYRQKANNRFYYLRRITNGEFNHCCKKEWKKWQN